MLKTDLKFWVGRDNTEDLALLADCVPVDAGNITRLVVELDNQNLDSDTDPDAFEWPVPMSYMPIGQSRRTTVQGVRLKFGAALPAGTYAGRLIAYDDSHPGGLVWGQLTIKVFA